LHKCWISVLDLDFSFYISRLDWSPSGFRQFDLWLELDHLRLLLDCWTFAFFIFLKFSIRTYCSFLETNSGFPNGDKEVDCSVSDDYYNHEPSGIILKTRWKVLIAREKHHRISQNKDTDLVEDLKSIH